MKTRTKIILFMLGTVVLYGFFIFYISQFNTKQIQIIINDNEKQEAAQFSKFIDLIAASQQFFVNDYSIWDDTLSFIKTKNKDFSKLYLDSALSVFDIDQVWVYSVDNKLAYSTSSVSNSVIKNYSFPDKALEQLFLTRQTSFFIETPDGIMQIYGSTIHPSYDINRKTIPGGYLFIGKLVDEKIIKALSGLSGGTVTLRNKDVPYSIKSNDDSSTYFFTVILQDWNDKDVAYIDVEVRSNLAQELYKSSNNFIKISTIFGGLILFVLFLLLYIFVTKPLQVLLDGLNNKSLDKIKILENKNDEFSQLAYTIDKFFEQQIKIEQEKARLDTLLESISDSIIGIDRNWNIVFLNGSASALLGLSLDNVKGKLFYDLFKIMRVRDRVEDRSYIEKALLYGKPSITNEEVYTVTSTGKEINMTSSAAPIFDIDKKAMGAVIIIHDISNERDSQYLRSDFAYASHQLRTPVTEATWAISEALEVSDINDKDKNLRIAERSIKSVHRLVEHLLEVSKVDQKTIIVQNQKVNVMDVIKFAVDMTVSHAKERKIDIKLPIGVDALMIETDSSLLQRVIFEIVDNAISYSEQGSEVFVKISNQPDGVLISVQNSGQTILEDQLPLVFTKFFRGSEASEKTPGAGLGLYIAREYLKLLKGKIWFTSEKGITTFFVFVPIS